MMCLCAVRKLKGVTLGTAKSKAQCTIVQALRPCTGCTVYTVLEVLYYSFLTTALEVVRGQRHG
jgi:hypothetical protein